MPKSADRPIRLNRREWPTAVCFFTAAAWQVIDGKACGRYQTVETLCMQGMQDAYEGYLR